MFLLPGLCTQEDLQVELRAWYRPGLCLNESRRQKNAPAPHGTARVRGTSPSDESSSLQWIDNRQKRS